MTALMLPPTVSPALWADAVGTIEHVVCQPGETMREGGTEGRRPTPGTHRFYAARHADTMRYRASERISFRNPLSLNSSSLPRRGERTEESAAARTVPWHRDQRGARPKARLEQGRRLEKLHHPPGCMGNDAGRSDAAIALDGIGHGAWLLGHRGCST
jgi:hypothetical protein